MGTIRKSQIEKVRNWLTSGKSISPLTALKVFGVLRLAAIIHTLRWNRGMDIVTDMTRGYATYRFTPTA